MVLFFGRIQGYLGVSEGKKKCRKVSLELKSHLPNHWGHGIQLISVSQHFLLTHLPTAVSWPKGVGKERVGSCGINGATRM